MSVKMKFIQETITELAYDFSPSQLQLIRGALVKTTSSYEMTEQEVTAVANIEDFNDILVKRYLVKKTLSGISEKSIAQYKRETVNFLRTIDKRATDITSTDIELYLMTYKAQRKISNTSMQNLICYIRNFFNFLEDEEIIQRNPFRKLPTVKGDTIPETVISRGEEERLYLNCDNLRDRALLEYFFATGCRVSEVCNAKLSDIDFTEKTIQVIGKGNKHRETYISDKALLHLKRYLENRGCSSNEYVFLSIRKPYKSLTPSGIGVILHRVSNSAKVDNIHPHRIRATFCTRLIDAGVPIHKVKEIMGHDSIETTMIYYRGSKNIKNEYQKVM